MTRWICLLRGVNVLGAATLPMKTLASSMERIGLKDVKTYIQSGNVVFSSRATSAAPLARRIRAAIAASCKIDPHVLLLTRAQLEDAARNNPFPEAAADHRTLHLFFLDSDPKTPHRERLEKYRAASERFALVGKVFYLHTPEGFGPSKLRNVVEKALGVPATVRNWRTVTKLVELAQGPTAPAKGALR